LIKIRLAADDGGPERYLSAAAAAKATRLCVFSEGM
jgi:hypothetical protein